MTGDELKAFRKRREWNQEQLAAFLADSLEGRSFSVNTISNWERGRTSPPEAVSALLQAIELDGSIGGLADGADALGGSQGVGGDDPTSGVPPPDAPPSPPAASATPPLGAAGLYARVCTELWEMIATGIGVAGAAIGSDQLMLDAAIIDADKQALGVAWGKLAETNETFRKMLAGMTEGGAWIQVALVTGTTASKVWRNHVTIPVITEGLPSGNGATAPAAV